MVVDHKSGECPPMMDSSQQAIASSQVSEPEKLTNSAPAAIAVSANLLTSVAELVDLGEDLLAVDRPWAFRGQPRPFETLTPSFQRQFSRRSVGAAQIIESKLIKAFREHYLSLNHRDPDMPDPSQIGAGYDLRCLSVMQHYEIPTRLLDWTSEYWIAVYFACASDPGEAAELWYYDRGIFDLQRRMNNELNSLVGETTAPLWEPSILGQRGSKLIVELDPGITPRMKKQHAHHTVSTEIFSEHAALLRDLHKQLASTTTPADNFGIAGLQRVLIDGSCKGKALQHLAENLEITAGTIFPDVVGLGRFLRWQFESLRTMLF